MQKIKQYRRKNALKKENQRLKALYIKEILLRETDEEHSLTAGKIADMLAKRGISAERKSIYNDIYALDDAGMLDIGREEGKNGGFRVLGRDFELAELKMLVDAVQSCRFISKKQCTALIKKLSALASRYEEKQLSRSVYVYDREEKPSGVLYLIDIIHRAISENRAITFKYTELTPSKKKVERRNGEAYRVSPWSLMWQEDNYYLIGFDHGFKEIRHYRVDRAEKITLLDEPRLGRNDFEKISLAKYYGNVFEMFRGREETVHFSCENRLAGAMLDRFGMSLNITEHGDRFEFYAPIEISVRFFSWVFGFDGALRIISPENVVREYREQIERAAEALGENKADAPKIF